MRLRYLAGMVGAFALVGVVCVSPVAAKPADTHVVCVSWDLDHWHEAIGPSRCNLHRRQSCWCRRAMVRLERTDWSYWDERHARGKAKEWVKGHGTVNARIKLLRPRLGHFSHHFMRFFSRAEITDRFGSRTFDLDVPLRNVLRD